jgi:Zinc finger, C2H2 type
MMQAQIDELFHKKLSVKIKKVEKSSGDEWRLFDVVFVCDKCSWIFVNEEFLRFHEKVYHRNGIIVNKVCCIDCGKLFSHQSDLMKHIDLEHENNNNESNNKKITDEKSQVHIKLQQKEEINDKKSKIFNCDDCNKSFTLQGNLKFHIDRFHQKGEKLHKCSSCPRSFNFTKNFDRHWTKEHKFLQEEKFWCKICSHKFTKVSNLIRHEDYFHQGRESKSFKCRQCSRSFHLHSNLTCHLKLKHDIVGKNYQQSSIKFKGALFPCDKCDKTFVRKANLVMHRELFHSKNTQGIHKCKLCKLSFKYKRNLQTHSIKEHHFVPDRISTKNEIKIGV